ncbi:cytochrome c oxidase assembly protein [Planococcus donghaensis]|uniref:Cytochrome c oxidase assembly protein n=1 Tax=Planococcus donghaensis TaxID=414778 RepID=A0A1C7EI48_9BACL|nr:cytochrome c oxidase assembly protein [Planococcus donghaensis]ANU23336.1 hypothetical protein BCM40_08100 [Planococcus donghaensis]
MHSHVQAQGTSFEIIVTLLLLSMVFLYPFAAIRTNRKYKEWPVYRYVFWITGVFSIGVALTGPLAEFAHSNFKGHMVTHLLIGMLAPLLFVFATPMTLLLRTLKVTTARKLTRVLKSRLLQFLTNPVTATVLNIGGLYVLYTTDLYMLMHQSLVLYGLIHLHVFLAGYLFTLSIIYVDVTSHRYSYMYRAIVLILAIAGHKILSKYIYANPLKSVPRADAEAGSMLMYYGGDLIELVLIIFLCYQWYKSTAPRFTNPLYKT